MKYILYISLFFWSGNIYACECLYADVSHQFKWADIVFLGEIIDKHELCSLGMEKGTSITCVGGPSVFLVQPYEAFKYPWHYRGGKNGKNHYGVYLIQGGSNCDFHFEVGEKYLVFGKIATIGMYVTNSCSGTTTSDVVKTINELRVLKSANDKIEKP